jgi:hypothetical protein
VNLIGSSLRTPSTATQQGNRLKSISLSGAQQFSKYVSTSLSVRYIAFDGAINPYREAGLSATLNLRF